MSHKYLLSMIEIQLKIITVVIVVKSPGTRLIFLRCETAFVRNILLKLHK